VVLAAFLLLARLRYTDTLVEQALRVVTAIGASSILWATLHSTLASGPGLAVAVIAMTAALTLVVPTIHVFARRITEKIFQQPDFGSQLHSLTEAIRECPSRQEVFTWAAPILQHGFLEPKSALCPLIARSV
jgi:hypothetical protein